ncbi:glycoside hydrolase family 16 protein [Dothistroma septosporum NZE10]|uniref:endo-1,3(4)-beta-glucanase n=1 Tax=Dothistroma septosporum (strain NZE10 / CBS 128990) TaxID=675120 RepID=N1PW79_DOTSN|nr:glycoside hydrolase family 16 protein [Dothistroma septosporum NZE10]
MHPNVSASHGEMSSRGGLPPPYESIDSLDKMDGKTGSKWNPRHWSKVAILCAIGAAVLLIVGVIIGAVLGSRANAYPNYSALSYTLADTYSGTDFFDNFDYFTGYDPTSGFVHYVPNATADSSQYNLTYASSDTAILRVDTSETNADTGRYSVRITSKKQYNSGLFVFDIVNTPYGCATWPALWLSDPNNWPAHGEIDVVEAVNQADTGNQATLHTTSGCKMNVKRKQTGGTLYKNCANTTHDNAGCGVQGAQDTYGETFNANGGGIYAMEWRTAGIRVWFFPRSDIPSDIPTDVTNTSAPDPSTWGTPLADFPSTNCDISTHFKNQSIIANIDLCGTWAGSTAVYTDQDQCPGTCTDFVATNNTAFETAYWQWNSWRVYTASA